MERKRIEKLVVLLLIGILLPVSLFPFPIYADTIDTHIRGRNYTYEPITYNKIQLTNNTYYQNIGVFHITFELDDEYIGYVLPNYSIQYDNYFYGAQTPNWGTLSSTFDRRVFVNGSSFSFDVSVNWNSININTAPGGDPFNYDSYTITSSDVTKYADIDSLDQIINILNDLYNSNYQIEGLLNDQLTQLQLVVSNTSLSNNYLNNIDDNLENIDNLIDTISWIEINTDKGYRSNLTDTITSWTARMGRFNGYLTFSYSNLATFDNILKIYLPVRYSGSLSDIRLYFDNGTDVTDKYLLYITRSRIGLILYMISDSSIGFYGTGYINIKGDYQYVYEPIGVNGNASLSYLPSDDIEYWQLKSFFINDKYLNLIANGTHQSQSASGSLDQATSQFSDDANDLVTIEETFNNSMNQSLQNVNPTFNMGSSFLTSANWVSQQFNRIVNNTPFASLITFGLTLGLGLLIIGKVRK